LLTACKGEQIGVIECVTHDDCSLGSWCSAENLCVTRVSLQPDAAGRIDASRNFLGIQGRFLASADGYGPSGLRDGRCQGNGHADEACSILTAPDPMLDAFPNEDGVLCTSGIAARVLESGAGPDHWGMWGAKLEFEFTDEQGASAVFDAVEKGVRGFSFDIDSVPITPFRVEFPTPGREGSAVGPEYWGGAPMFPRSPVVGGINVVSFDLVRSPNLAVTFDASKIQTIAFHTPGLPEQASPFAYCVSNFSMLSAADPVLDSPNPGAAGAILVDNFDDLDMNTLDPRFSPWLYTVYNARADTPSPTAVAWIDAQAALNSRGGLHFSWSTQDMPDGAVESTGAVLTSAVSPADVYLDLSRYSRLVIAHRLVPELAGQVPDRGPNCVPLQEIVIDFACPEFGTSFVGSIPVSSDYTTATFSFSDLAERSWQATGATRDECLSRVEGIGFFAAPPLQDGECSTGHLFFDNISIR